MIIKRTKNYWQKRIGQGLAILRKVAEKEKIKKEDYDKIEDILKPYINGD
jgi:hypothetical protein